jgi:hypothetical protein
MGLPDPDAVRTWGGRLLVDRDGMEIGTCTEIFVDDATGLPEWATADLSGGPAFIPLVDAAEAGDRVRVAVRQTDVADAPSVSDARHISEDEEERLYRHYGIEFSRQASDSLLPSDEPLVSPEPASSTSSAPEGTGAEGGPQTSGLDAPGVGGTDESGATTPQRQQVQLLPSLAGGIVVALAAISAAVLWWRRRRQAPPTRQEQLAARARAASHALGTRRHQVAASAAPLLQTSRRLSAAAAQQAAVQARAAAGQAAVQARSAAGQAAVQARSAAEQAAALAAVAKTARRPRVSWGDDVESVPSVVSPETGRQQDRHQVLGALKAAAGFGAGYALGSRAGRRRFEQLKQATTTWVQRPEVQQTAGRVRTRFSEGLQSGNARLSGRASAVTERVRRRSGSSGEVLSDADDGSQT